MEHGRLIVMINASGRCGPERTRGAKKESIMIKRDGLYLCEMKWVIGGGKSKNAKDCNRVETIRDKIM